MRAHPASVAVCLALTGPGVAFAEVCDKMDCGTAPELWMRGVPVVLAMFAAWSWRLWLGALATLPLGLVACWDLMAIDDPLFGAAIRAETGPTYVASAMALPALTVAALIAGLFVRVNRLAPGPWWSRRDARQR